ncbi:MAG: DUF3110 domain-containing protein [bacterium]|jgi:hypothetical protein
MYILTLEGREEQGAYSVTNQKGQQILYLFEEEDDAVRFAMMLEEDDYPSLVVIEIDDDLIIKTCEINRYEYAIITANDIVIPPEQNDII